MHRQGARTDPVLQAGQSYMVEDQIVRFGNLSKTLALA